MNKSYLYSYRGCNIYQEDGVFTVYRMNSYWGFAPTTWEADAIVDELNLLFNNK